jgi:stearoyl-CoA desaturase (delta-9 desaturase)
MAVSKSMVPISPRLEQKPTKTPEKSAWVGNALAVAWIHFLALYACVAIAPTRPLLYSLLAQYQMAMFGIGVGYHRLWSHRAFKATLPVRIVLMLWGTMGLQGSAKWWVLRHRLHHRYTDTAFDPYNATRGFWFSHIGWIFEKPQYDRLKYVDKKDLEEDWCVRFQHKWFVPLAVLLNFGLPTLIAIKTGSGALQGFLWGAMVPRVVIWHVTFCINSYVSWRRADVVDLLIGLATRNIPMKLPPRETCFLHS